jgi:hypothetical protein
MPHLPHAHHKTSKHDSPNETRVKEKQNETVPDLNSNLAKSMTHHNQTKEHTNWFLTMTPDKKPSAVENFSVKFSRHVKNATPAATSSPVAPVT